MGDIALPAGVEVDPPSEEPPALAFVRNYWLRARGAHAMPRHADIVAADLKEFRSHILLADVVDGGADFRYRTAGLQLLDYFVVDPRGALMSQAIASFGPQAVRATLDTYRAVVARRAPLRIRGVGTLYSQRLKFFDALLTPLSDDGETVDMIFGAFIFEWSPA